MCIQSRDGFMNVNIEASQITGHYYGHKGRVRLCQKTLKVLWTNETQMNVYQNNVKRQVWRRKRTAQGSGYSMSSVKHGGGCVMA